MTGESRETSLKGLFQGMIPRDVELLQGTVISTNPLRIQMVNDSKLIISSISTVIPEHLTDHTETITDASGVSAQITVHRALQTGDRLHLLSVQRGKKYFVLGRV